MALLPRLLERYEGVAQLVQRQLIRAGGLTSREQLVFLLQPDRQGGLPVGIIDHAAEVAELAADLLGPIAAGVGEEGEVLAGLPGGLGACRIAIASPRGSDTRWCTYTRC